MPFNFPKFLSSRTIEVRSDSKSFFAHGDILTAQSELLRSTITNDTPEKKVDFSACDSDTVERFLQFLYYSDHQVPETVTEIGEGREESDRLGGASTPDTVQSQAVQEETLHGYPVTNVLLVHARLYALAEHTKVHALQTMSLKRLSEALEEIDNCTDRLSRVMVDVIELLDYSYSEVNLRMTTHTDLGEPVRGLASSFAAKNFNELMEQREMSFLLREGGSLVVEVMEKVAKGFCSVQKISKMEREVQGWKHRAMVLEERMKQLEGTKKEEIRRVEAKKASPVSTSMEAYRDKQEAKSEIRGPAARTSLISKKAKKSTKGKNKSRRIDIPWTVETRFRAKIRAKFRPMSATANHPTKTPPLPL